jgi:hypothetical protein
MTVEEVWRAKARAIIATLNRSGISLPQAPVGLCRERPEKTAFKGLDKVGSDK